jgi:hypothetical protein
MTILSEAGPIVETIFVVTKIYSLSIIIIKEQSEYTVKMYSYSNMFSFTFYNSSPLFES